MLTPNDKVLTFMKVNLASGYSFFVITPLLLSRILVSLLRCIFDSCFVLCTYPFTEVSSNE